MPRGGATADGASVSEVHAHLAVARARDHMPCAPTGSNDGGGDGGGDGGSDGGGDGGGDDDSKGVMVMVVRAGCDVPEMTSSGAGSMAGRVVQLR